LGNFFINLGNFLSEYYSISIIAIICLVIYLIYICVPKIFDYSSNKKITKYKHINSKDLQRDNYYRSISGDTLSRILSDWISIYQSVNNGTFSKDPEAVDKVTKSVNDLLEYSSKNTVAICAVFYRDIYNFNFQEDEGASQKDEGASQKDEGVSEYTFEILFILGALISSLKNDFSGEYIDPKDIIDIKIKDIYKYKKQYENGIESAKNKLGKLHYK